MANNETSIIISAVDKTQGALNSVNNNLSSLEGQFSKLTGVVSGFAALAGVTAFAGIAKGAIDTAAGLHDMAQQTGASVESLSAMRGAAKLAGVDMEQVAGGLGKLSKNMLAAAQGSGDAEKVFKALGISVADSSGKMKSSEAVFMEFSKSMQGVSSNTERVAAAQLVFGKSGAALIPLMNDLAASGELQAKVTAEQAAAADQLADTLDGLAINFDNWKTSVIMDMVPAANAFAEAMLEMATKSADANKIAKELGADVSVKQWAIEAAKAVGFVVDSFDGASRVVKAIGATIGAAAGQAALIAKGDFAGAMAIGKMWLADLDKLAQGELFSDVLARRIAAIGTEAPKAAQGTTSLANALNGLSGEGGKAAKVLADLHLTQMALVTKQAAAELEALTKQQEEYAKALQSALSPLETQAQNLEREVANYGLTESAIQSTIIARMEEARVIAAANGAWPEHLNYLDQEIELRKRIATAAGQKETLDTNKKAAEAAAKEWEKFAGQVEQSLTDALMRSLESGESYGDAFIKNLKNTFKTAGLKLVIQTVTGTSGSLVNSAINWAAGTSSSDGGKGTDYLGLASNAYSLYSGATAAYAAYGATGTGLTAAETTSAAWAYLQSGEIGTAVGVAIKGYFSTVATETIAADAAAAAAAKVAATKAAEIAATEAAIDSGALGGAASSVSLAGVPYLALPALALALIQGLSGSTQKYQTGAYLNGTFSGDGFDGSTRDDYHREGGWANDDKNYTSVVPLITTASRLYDASETGQYGYFPGGGNLTGQDSYTPLPARYSGDDNLTSEQIDAMQANQVAMFNQTKANLAAALVQRQALDTALGTLYTNIKDSVATNLGTAFEDTSFAEKLKGFTHDIDVSLMSGDMTAMFTNIGTELTAAMQSFLLPSVATVKTQSVDLANSLKTSLEQATASGDTTGAEALKTKITQLEAVGAETWTQTFGRMMQETQAVAGVLDLFGTTLVETFGKNNMDGILKMSDNLVNLFGGIDAMNTSVNAYYGNFYSEEEKTARSWEMMGKSFASLNLTMPTTRDGFKDLVDGLDLNTLAGQATFKSLMDLQGGFATLVPAIEDVAATSKKAAEELANWKTETLAQFTPAKTVQQAAQAINDAGFYGAPSQLMTNMDLSGFNAAIAGIITNASPETKMLYEKLAGDIKIVQDSLIGFSDAAAQAADAAHDVAQSWITKLATPLTPQQASQKIIDGGLYGKQGDDLSTMSLAGFKTAISGIATGASEATDILISGMTPYLDTVYEYLLAVDALTNSLTSTLAGTEVEILRALGDNIGADDAERTLAINRGTADTSDDMNAEQIGLYDTNAARRKYLDGLIEEKGLQDEYDTLTMTSAQLLNKQRDALDESNRGLFDQINAIKAANTALADLAQQLEAIGGARTNLGNAKQSVISQMSTFDAPSYYEAQKAILSAQFSSAGSTDQKVTIAGKWQEAINSGMQAQITALDKARDVRLKALQDESTLAEENAAKAKQSAESMASALASIADYANGLKTSNLSTLSPEDKLAAAGSEYQRLLSAAQGGDADAAGKLTGASDNYLGLAKDYYASTDAYSSIFASVEQSLGSLGSQASIYEQIAATALSTYDLASATAAADAAYQTSVLAIQQSAVDQFTFLDGKLAEYQVQQQFSLDEQILQLNLLNVKNDVIGDKITASQSAITAGLSRVETAQTTLNTTLTRVEALLAAINASTATTATATTTTATATTSASTLAGAV
jgi:hypothetical protein